MEGSQHQQGEAMTPEQVIETLRSILADDSPFDATNRLSPEEDEAIRAAVRLIRHAPAIENMPPIGAALLGTLEAAGLAIVAGQWANWRDAYLPALQALAKPTQGATK